MDTQTKIKCPACNTTLQVIYYQRRAADEPPDKVVYCENCPLDTTRLKLQNQTIETRTVDYAVSKDNSKIVNKHRKQKNKIDQNRFSSSLSKVGTGIVIKVQGNAAQRCYKRILELNLEPEHIVGSPVQITLDNKFASSYYYFNSVLKERALLVDSSETIAPFITQRNISVYKLSVTQSFNVNKYMLGYEYKLDTITYCTDTVLRVSHDGHKPYILTVVSLDNSAKNTKDTTILEVLNEILVLYGTELSIKSIMSNTLLNTCYIQSGRAYDHPFAPETGFTYTWKPDGERYWYIKYGSIWVYCKRLLSGRISGWNMCKTLQRTTFVGPALDVEVMVGHPPILIDILVSGTGVALPSSRTLNSVLSEYSLMIEMKTLDIPIFVRNYYRSVKELTKTKDSIGYPIDGIVGIEDGSMTIIKLKTEKSMELELKDNGDLVTADNYKVAKSDLQNTYLPGSIIEIRFTADDNTGEPIINSSLLRTDKLKANDYEACKNIFTTISDTPNSLAMRKAVLWCNSIRQKLNQIASNVMGVGRVILDIGAGDGQSVSDYSTNPEVTYILLEPNSKKCKRMMRRLNEDKKGSCRLYDSAKYIITAAGLVSTGKLKYAVVCATLSEILNQQHCVRTLRSCIRCCIASFSISYIAEELQTLSLNGITTIGCGYMYNSVNENGVLVHENGVTMKYINPDNYKKDKRAIVIWGSDTPYEETGVVLEDFKDTYYCRLAKNTVPVANDANISLLSTISTKVYIISTSKYL